MPGNKSILIFLTDCRTHSSWWYMPTTLFKWGYRPGGSNIILIITITTMINFSSIFHSWIQHVFAFVFVQAQESHSVCVCVFFSFDSCRVQHWVQCQSACLYHFFFFLRLDIWETWLYNKLKFPAPAQHTDRPSVSDSSIKIKNKNLNILNLVIWLFAHSNLTPNNK
jgi:hypothetical protein